MGWLELIPAGLVIIGVGGVTVPFCLFPQEGKRLLRMIRAEITAKLGNVKRPSIEIALHADLEVDMKWWDEEFAKLERAIPDASWSNYIASRVINPDAPTLSELERLHKRTGTKSVTDGDVTYSFSNLASAHQAGWMSLYEMRKKLEEELLKFERDREKECEFCQYEEVLTYTAPCVKRYKTEECWECEAGESKARWVEEPIGIYTPAADEQWGIS